MNKHSRLISIKLFHTTIWVFFNVVLFYMAYAVIIDQIDEFIWMGVALIIAEGLVLLLFKMKCPLTLAARKYSDSDKDNFDIYLPNWLAKYNKVIYTTFFIVMMGGLLFRILSRQ